MEKLKGFLPTAFVLLMVYGMSLGGGAAWLCGILLSAVVAYQVGIHVQKTRADQERWRLMEAAKTPEQRAREERERIRSAVIDALPQKDKVIFIVPGSDPRYGELLRQVDEEVERRIQDGQKRAGIRAS